jgi:transcriptional regulator with XRE-family HTH domain
MSSPESVLMVLRSEMRAAGITYRLLADRIGMSESSVKRVFSSGDMSLSRLARICKAAGISMEDVLRQAADSAPRADTLTLAQERALVSEPKLLLVGISCVGHWSFEQIVNTYNLSEAECVRCLVKLDRLGLIELKPMNRYRMKVSRAFRWRADGPVQHFFREYIVNDYFAGRFDGPRETLLCVHGRLSEPSAIELVQKIQQLTGELARLHQDDQRLPAGDRDGCTLLLGFRSWEFGAFTAMRREASAHDGDHQKGPRKR